MKIFSNKKRAAAIGAVTAATVLGGTVAFAYWTTTGSGTGTASAGSGVGWGVVTSAAVGLPLAPTTPTGDPSQSVGYTITNTGTGQQLLSQAVISIASVTQADGAVGACGTSDFGLNGANASVTDEFGGGSGVDLAVGGTQTGSVTVRLINSSANQNGCKGATVNLSVVAS